MLWIWQRKSNDIRDIHSHIWDEWADDNGSIGKAYGYQQSLMFPYRRITEEGLRRAFPDGRAREEILFCTDNDLHAVSRFKGRH